MSVNFPDIFVFITDTVNYSGSGVIVFFKETLYWLLFAVEKDESRGSKKKTFFVRGKFGVQGPKAGHESCAYIRV